MSTLYDRIVYACKEHGCTPGRMCDDLGIRRGFMSELKNAKTQYVSCDKIAFMSDYLNVSCDYLLKGVESDFIKPEERDLIHAYRIAPIAEQENIRFMLRNYMPISLDSEEVQLA